MAKNEKEKVSIMEMFRKVNTKTIDLVHRGPLLRLLSNAVYRCEEPDEETCVGYYVVRLPFGDYGDLTVDNQCLEYLNRVRLVLEETYQFHEIAKELKAKGETIKDDVYRKYCEWLAINAVFDFLYIGDYYENQIA